MKRLHILLLAAAPLVATGCWLTSAQVLVTYELPTLINIASVSNSLHTEAIDLHTIEDYEEHKDEIDGVNDLAILGSFENVLGDAATVEIWITGDHTRTFANAADVMANGGVRLWGPVTVGPASGPGSFVQLSWDDSAALFDPAGERILVDEAKGDGRFAVHIIGQSAGAYRVIARDGLVVLVIDADV